MNYNGATALAEIGNAVAVLVGHQAGDELWSLLRPIPGHAAGDVVTRQAIEWRGFALPINKQSDHAAKETRATALARADRRMWPACASRH